MALWAVWLWASDLPGADLRAREKEGRVRGGAFCGCMLERCLSFIPVRRFEGSGCLPWNQKSYSNM